MRALLILSLLCVASCARVSRVTTPLEPVDAQPQLTLGVAEHDLPPEEVVEPAFASTPQIDPLLAEPAYEDLGDDVTDGALGGHLVAGELGGHREPERSQDPGHPGLTHDGGRRARWVRLLPQVVLDGVWTQQTVTRLTAGPGRDARQRSRTTQWLAMVRLQWRGRRRWRAARRTVRLPRQMLSLLLVVGGCAWGTAQPHAQTPAPPAEVERRTRELRAQLAAEPSLRHVQQAALRFLGLDGPGLSVGRVRASAWLPHVAQVSAGWTQAGGQRDDDTYTRTGPPDGAWDSLQWRALDRVDATTRQDIGVRLQWDLQALVWNDDELNVLAHQRRMDEARQRVLQVVAQTYHRRRRAMATLWLEWDASAEVRLGHEFDVEALTAELDAMTGGWFAQALVAATTAARDP